jgi:iron(III) transport system substrate-binding protein
VSDAAGVRSECLADQAPALTRRDALRTFAASAAALAGVAPIASCKKRSPNSSSSAGSTPEARTVTLVTSIDAFLLDPIVRAFEAHAQRLPGANAAPPIKVRLATDTEATKAMGLVQSLIARRDDPVADVWWSGEVLGSVSLARAGLLASWQPTESPKDLPGGVWPANHADPLSRWHGHAQRARVIAYSPARVKSPPRSLSDLLDPKLRVGLAQPQFGSTRSHVAGLLSLDAQGARAWLSSLAKTARTYPGNSAVVRAIATGEIDMGLTDSDDVWVGRRQGWDLGVSFAGATLADGPERAFLFPATVGVIAYAPHPDEARLLADFLLSAPVERLLAASESKNYPIRDTLREELAHSTPELRLPLPRAEIAWNDIDAALDEADRMIRELMPV